MRLMGALLVIWEIITLSFFLMRMAPGGPFDSDKRLPEAVEQNLWKTYGMAETIHADNDGIVEELLVSRDAEIKKGDALVRLEDGTSLRSDRDGEVLGILLHVGEELEDDVFDPAVPRAAARASRPSSPSQRSTRP